MGSKGVAAKTYELTRVSRNVARRLQASSPLAAPCARLVEPIGPQAGAACRARLCPQYWCQDTGTRRRFSCNPRMNAFVTPTTTEKKAFEPASFEPLMGRVNTNGGGGSLWRAAKQRAASRSVAAACTHLSSGGS